VLGRGIWVEGVGGRGQQSLHIKDWPVAHFLAHRHPAKPPKVLKNLLQKSSCLLCILAACKQVHHMPNAKQSTGLVFSPENQEASSRRVSQQHISWPKPAQLLRPKGGMMDAYFMRHRHAVAEHGCPERQQSNSQLYLNMK